MDQHVVKSSYKMVRQHHVFNVNVYSKPYCRSTFRKSRQRGIELCLREECRVPPLKRRLPPLRCDDIQSYSISNWSNMLGSLDLLDILTTYLETICVLQK